MAFSQYTMEKMLYLHESNDPQSTGSKRSLDLGLGTLGLAPPPSAAPAEAHLGVVCDRVVRRQGTQSHDEGADSLAQLLQLVTLVTVQL